MAAEKELHQRATCNIEDTEEILLPSQEMGLQFDVSKIWFRSITLNYTFSRGNNTFLLCQNSFFDGLKTNKRFLRKKRESNKVLVKKV